MVPVVAEGDRFLFADVAGVLANKQAGRKPSQAPSPAIEPPTGRTRIAARFEDTGRRALDAARDFLLATPDRPGIARSLRVLLKPLGSPKSPRARPTPPNPARNLDDFDRCDGSILLLLDSSWTIPIWPGTHRFKERGGRVVGVIYDLIPITHSHTSVSELTAAFKVWIAQHLRWTDGLVCISKSIANSLADYIASASTDVPGRPRPQIRHFHLGSELDFIGSDDTVRGDGPRASSNPTGTCS